MRHIAIRSIMALILIGIGVFGLATGRGESNIFSIIMGIVFGYSAYAMWKKNREETKND